jgi:hypothetical protein
MQKERLCKDTERKQLLQAKEKASGETKPTPTLIMDFQFLDL